MILAIDIDEHELAILSSALEAAANKYRFNFREMGVADAERIAVQTESLHARMQMALRGQAESRCGYDANGSPVHGD